MEMGEREEIIKEQKKVLVVTAMFKILLVVMVSHMPQLSKL